MPELAGAIEVDLKTLRGYCDAGLIDCVLKGTGKKRAHRIFTLAHVEDYYRRRTMRGDELSVHLPARQAYREPSPNLRPRPRKRLPRRTRS
jgi:hypothetical protein